MRKAGAVVLLVGLAGCSWILPPLPPNSSPSVTEVVPADNAGGVATGAAVKADLDLPNGGLDPRSVTERSVRLVEAATGTAVPAQVSVTDDAERLTYSQLHNY